MRILNFAGKEDTESFNRFDICYGAIKGNPLGWAKADRKMARRLVRKFEDIGTPIENPTGIAKVELGQEPVELALEEAEYDLLRKTIDDIPWTKGWELADDCLIWLDSIQEPKKEKKVAQTEA